MQTTSIGEILKQHRTRQHLSIEALAQQTKIQPRFIMALEENRFDVLPASSFVKGFIKASSRVLGFDPQPLFGLLRRDYKENSQGTLVPREFLHPVLRTKQFWTPAAAITVVAAIMFGMVFSYVGWQWYSLNKPPRLEIEQPQPDQVVAPNVAVKGQTSPEAIVLINNQPVALTLEGEFESEVYLPREGISTITIEAKDRKGKTTIVQRTVQVQF